MLAPAVMFWQVVLAVHILAVVAGFGVIFAYPILVITADRLDPRSIPTVHRLQQAIGRRIISPGLGLVLICGIYLASDLHQWKQFYVQWAVAIVVILGGLEGAVMVRSEGKLAELAERDLAAAGDGKVTWSKDYLSLRARAGMVGTLMTVLVIITVYLMTIHSV